MLTAVLSMAAGLLILAFLTALTVEAFGVYTPEPMKRFLQSWLTCWLALLMFAAAFALIIRGLHL